MWEFIVSGQVPGSAIQITFDLWLKAMGLLLASVIALKLIAAILRHRRVVKLMLDTPQVTETSAS